MCVCVCVKDEINDPIEKKSFRGKFFRRVVFFICRCVCVCVCVGGGGGGGGSSKGGEQTAVSRLEDFTMSVEVF